MGVDSGQSSITVAGEFLPIAFQRSRSIADHVSQSEYGPLPFEKRLKCTCDLDDFEYPPPKHNTLTPSHRHKNDDGTVFLGDGSLAGAPAPKLHQRGIRNVIKVVDDRCL
jgi:hypothetical protein